MLCGENEWALLAEVGHAEEQREKTNRQKPLTPMDSRKKKESQSGTGPVQEISQNYPFLHFSSFRPYSVADDDLKRVANVSTMNEMQRSDKGSHFKG